MAAAIRTGGVSPDIAGALVNAGSNVGIAAGAALGAQVFGTTGLGLAALPFVAAVVVGASLVVVVLGRRGFPVSGHTQSTLSTSSLRTITSSVSVVTASIATVQAARTGSVPTGPAVRGGRRSR